MCCKWWPVECPAESGMYRGLLGAGSCWKEGFFLFHEKYFLTNGCSENQINNYRNLKWKAILWKQVFGSWYLGRSCSQLRLKSNRTAGSWTTAPHDPFSPSVHHHFYLLQFISQPLSIFRCFRKSYCCPKLAPDALCYLSLRVVSKLAFSLLRILRTHRHVAKIFKSLSVIAHRVLLKSLQTHWTFSRLAESLSTLDHVCLFLFILLCKVISDLWWLHGKWLWTMLQVLTHFQFRVWLGHSICL